MPDEAKRRNWNIVLIVALGAVLFGKAVELGLRGKDAPPEIVEARKTVKRLKFEPWDVEICKTYQLAGHKVCVHDRESGYDDNGEFDSMGNYLTNNCDEWIERAANYCPKCTRPGKCDEPFE